MIITRGQSDKNWIYFKSSENIRATALRTPSGDIELRVEEEEDILKEELKNFKAVDFFKFLLGLFLGLGMPFVKGYFLVPKIRDNLIDINFYLFPVLIYAILQFICILFVVIKGGKKLRKNHGAEHKVFNAYRKLKRVPTIKEAQRFSRICKTCGGTIPSAMIIAQIIGFIVYIHFGIVIPEKVLYIVPLFIHGFFPFNILGKLLQLLTTAEPDDSNVDLAIAALEALDEKENPKMNPEELIELANSLFGKSKYTM